MGQETITKILLRRGTDADRQSVVLAAGEPGWTTDTNKLYIGDGSTPGGVEVSAASADLVTGFEHLSANNLYAYTDSDIKVRSSFTITRPGTNNSIEIGKDQTSDNAAFIDLVGDTTYTDFALRLIRGSGGANTDSSLIHRGTGSLNINVKDTGALKFKTSDTQRVVIKSDGKVGIGTDAPNHELTVVGDISATGTIHGGVPGIVAVRHLGDINAHGASSPSDGTSSVTTTDAVTLNPNTTYILQWAVNFGVDGSASGTVTMAGEAQYSVGGGGYTKMRDANACVTRTGSSGHGYRRSQHLSFSHAFTTDGSGGSYNFRFDSNDGATYWFVHDASLTIISCNDVTGVPVYTQ